MYRIRSASGNEVSYSSLEEFSAAVRRGEVHPEDMIFHTRANRWLDVKSHPHYRSATSWHGHEHGASIAPRAPASAGAPAHARPAPSPSPSSSRAQVFERPVVRTSPQTTLRPQLQPAAPAPAPEPASAQRAEAPAAPKQETPQRYGPPRKSKELAFIDIGDSSPTTKPKVADPAPPATVAPPTPVAKVESKTAPAPVQTESPATAPTGPGSEVEFLVMDGGIESPVRTSAGQKAVPEDLDLLFDAPLPQDPGGSPAPTRGKAVVGVPRKGAPAPRSGKVSGVQGGSPPATAQAAEKPEAAAAETPATTIGRIQVAPIDLEVPSGPLVETATAPVADTRTRQPLPGRSNTLVLGGGLALLAVVGTLLAWRPWRGASSVTEATAEPTPTSTTALVGPPAPTPIRTATTMAATKPGTPTKSADGSPGGTKTDAAAEDEVIAAAKPTFRTDLAVPPAADLGVAPPAIGLPSGTTASPSELAARLLTAERQAQKELDGRLSAAGFRNVLGADRLGTASGVGAARSAWSAGTEAIRQYRGRLARLESAYEDSVLSAQRAQRWSSEEMRAWASRQSLAEPAETSQLADLMFSQVNEGLEILAALDGDYTIKDQTISFKNATSATRYTSIRGWVAQRTSSWAGTPESARPYSVTVILRALGEGLPSAQ
jgi:hypothetical protein